MGEQDLVALLAFLLLAYLCISIGSAIHLADKASSRWPRQRRDGRFIILGLVSVIILGVLWPLTYPAIWMIRSFVDSEASCFGLNYPRLQDKRNAKKAQRAQDIELGRMEHANRLEEQRVREVNEEADRYEAAKARVAAKRAAMLGTGTGTGPTFHFDEGEELTSRGHNYECPRERTRREAGTGASSRSDDEVGIEARTGMHMPNATVSDARGGWDINGPPHNEGYIVVPRPVVLPPYLPRSTTASSQTGGGSSPKPPSYCEFAPNR